MPAVGYALIVVFALASAKAKTIRAAARRAASQRDTEQKQGVMDDKARIDQQHSQLCSWLCDAAYPLWSTRGVDPAGGFHERLAQNGEPLAEPRRSRVNPRQAYCFAVAPSLGWRGDSAALVKHGLDYFVARYQRPDGLFRTLVAADGSSLDDRALLYDQAFALLAFNVAAARR